MTARARRLALVVSTAGAALLATVAGCGYHAVHGAESQRLHVVLVRAAIAEATVNDEVVTGVRNALAQEGALASGSGYPRVEVEVLRADEASEGIAAVSRTDGSRVPRARASSVGVVARAWIVRVAGGEHEGDTGDVRAFDLLSTPAPGEVDGDLLAAGLRHEDALRATARRVGERLGRRLLGHPMARDEGVGP